jgi:hypothetical protein
MRPAQLAVASRVPRAQSTLSVANTTSQSILRTLFAPIYSLQHCNDLLATCDDGATAVLYGANQVATFRSYHPDNHPSNALKHQLLPTQPRPLDKA